MYYIIIVIFIGFEPGISCKLIQAVNGQDKLREILNSNFRIKYYNNIIKFETIIENNYFSSNSNRNLISMKLRIGLFTYAIKTKVHIFKKIFLVSRFKYKNHESVFESIDLMIFKKYYSSFKFNVFFLCF